MCDGLPDARLWLAGGGVSSLGPGAFTMQSQWEMLLFRRLIPCCRKALVFLWPLERSGGHMRFHADFPLAVKVTRRNKKFCLSVGTGSGRVPTAWPQVCVSFRKSGMLSAGRKAGRQLVSSETPCICNGFSLEMLVCPTVEVAPGRRLFFRGSFAFRLV